MSAHEPKVSTRSYWLVQGLDGIWLEPDDSETAGQAIEAAKELGTAYRHVTSIEVVQDFEV